MHSSSWLAVAWPRRSRREPSIGNANLPQDDRGPRLSALRRRLSKPRLAHHRDAPSARWHDRHDLRLSRPPRTRPLSRIRGVGRRFARLLAERHLGDGDPILLGSGGGQPRTLRHGADEFGGHSPRDGPRRRLCQPHEGRDHPAGRVGPLWRQLLVVRSPPRSRRIRPHHQCPLLPRDAARESLPFLSARSLAAVRCHAGADLLPQRFLLSRPQPRRGRRRRRVADSADPRARRDSPAHSAGNAAVHSAVGRGPRRGGADHRLCCAVADQPSLPQAPRPPGRPAHSPIHMSTAIRQSRGFHAATRLGCQISSNWTQPLVFVLYSVLRPLSAAFILVVMYRVISGGGANTAAYLAFLVSGVAFWSFVQYGFAGLSNGIAEDRGEYKMLKYVYTSPAHFYVYLLGRGLAQLASAVASALIVLVVATIALRLPIDPRHVNYPLLLGSSFLALLAVIGMAMAFGLLLLRAIDNHGYGEAGAGVLYVISGAIFPISVLPGILAAIASLSPLVYWMELIRRSLLGSQAIRMFPALSDADALLRPLLTTL